MTLALGLAAGTAVAADVVYVEGAPLTIVILAFVFLFVAWTENYWFIGAGLVVILVSGLFMVFSWQSLADYPSTYQAGSTPVSKTEGTGLYETWALGSAAHADTSFTLDAASDADSLAGDLHLGYGCAPAKVAWRIYAGDSLLRSGTFREGDERDLTKVALRPGTPPATIRLTAERVDAAECELDLYWHNPGLEGPGNGRFRYVFPLPGD